ncbi:MULTISPECIES: purine-nucleoside phosphorylase [Desulfosediminicola]|uniref:purine-nucleoside phosphorylase n=1 Tax=Desulfosediminicola TaxID=2886823 RepID=UPI0010ABBEF2|nr:purine-nucleoside phosphorylase [Desulfosediminicola ganghwensis]
MADSSFAAHVRKVTECVAHFRDTLPFMPRTVIQLGTGLSGFADKVENALVIPYSEIPHFPASTVESHQGNLIIGTLEGEQVAVLQGRFHFYEGYSTKEVTFPIRVLSLLGARLLILTNAAGGLNPIIAPGSIMAIRDHLNFLGENPLRGPNIDEWGPRFPDLSVPYHPGLIKTAMDCATTCGLKNVISGTYACIPGPSLETPAETRWLRDSGADAVGMSSVPEVIVARHAGMEVLGLSVVSNVNDPDNFQPILLEDIIATAAKVTPQLQQLVTEVTRRLPSLSI